MKKILLLWYMKDDNFGDTLIADTTSVILKKNGYSVENYEIGDNPEEIISMANICDLLLFAGGGIIERYIPPILRKFDKYLEELVVPFGVIGVSVGNFNYDCKSVSLGKWIDNALFFYTRDKRSEMILNQYSVFKRAKYSGDCVFCNSRINENHLLKGLKTGINIRDLPYEDLMGKLNYGKVKEIINNTNVEIVIMDSSYEIKNFLLNSKDIGRYKRYCKKNKIEKAEQIISEISTCKIIIAMRYHVILVAAMMGIPTIAIKYCPKVETLVEQLGIQDLAVDIGDYNGIILKYKYLCNHYDKYEKKLSDNITKIKKRVDIMYEDVISILGKM